VGRGNRSDQLVPASPGAHDEPWLDANEPPWLVNPVGLAPDGSGGLWITAFGNSALFAIHRSATGTWSRVKIGPNASVIRITLIPGSTSLWGAGGGQDRVRTKRGRVGARPARLIVWAEVLT
jgi:hypothetical protein